MQTAQDWLQRAGVTDAGLTRRNMELVLGFFRDSMPGLDDAKKLSLIKGIDLHKTVSRVMLSPGQTFGSWRHPSGDPYGGLFYTRIGTSVRDLGVNPANRALHRYVVTRLSPALESFTTGIRDTWTAPTAFIADGGGRQYMIPDARNSLRLTLQPDS